MLLSYTNKKTMQLFSSKNELQQKFGNRQAQRIMECIKVLEACQSLSRLYEFKFLRPHELKGREKGRISLDLNHPYRLLIEPHIEGKTPKHLNRDPDWEKIDKVIIIGVRDTHDGKIIR